jgi:LuxR family transcriptional regulator, maltose regulon positive regulatory protein
MAVPILYTKVSTPHRSNNLVTRQRLLDLIEESLERKLTLVVAPAGYGKTSLLVDIAYHHEFPFCWYSLDQMDNDLAGFLSHFIACIEQRFSKYGERSRAALFAMEQGNLSLEHCETVIVNEIYNTIVEHFVIVLDDYHLVNEHAEINQFVNGFIQKVDQNCHVVILSRMLLTLPALPLFVARSQASGIGMQELAFHPDEIRALLLQNYHQLISDGVAQELAQKTDGWITGLLLAAPAMWQGMLHLLQSQQSSGVQLYDYLANQVLDRQSAEMRDFLLRTSFMDEFNPELCQELLGQPPVNNSWRAMMELTLSQNLFVLVVGKDGFWLRYHHLFQDFLQDRLRLENPQQAFLIQQSLIGVYSRRQEWQKAYTVCLSLGDLDTTGDFLEHAGEEIVRSGRTAMLKSWLETLPNSFIASRPALLARMGIVLASQGDAQRGMRLLDQAAKYYTEQQDDKHLAGVLVWRSLVYFLQAKWNDSLADAQEVLNLTVEVSDDEALTRFRAEAHRILGQNYRLLGNLQQSIEHHSQALNIYQAQHDARGYNLIQAILGAAYYDIGDLSSARACYQQALEYYRAQGDLFSQAGVLNDLAVLYYTNGEYLLAFSTFELVLDIARRGSNTRAETLALIGMGDLFIDLDTPETALEAYRQAREQLERRKDHFLNTYLYIAEASAIRLQKNFAKAMDLLQMAKDLMGSTPSNYTRGLWLLESGRLALANGDHAQAQEQFSQAAGLFEVGGQRMLAGQANLLLSGVLFAQRQYHEADLRLEKAFQAVSDLDSQHVLVCTASYVKPLLASTQLSPVNGLRARRLLEQVEHFQNSLFSLRRSLRFQKTEIQLSPPALDIQALGAARVLLDGKPVNGVDWQAQNTRELLLLILSKPQGWSKETLGEILWPESSPVQLKNRFKNVIYRLRRALRQDVILFDGEHYTFNRNLDYSYDVERFDQLLAQAKEATAAQARRQILEELLQLYQGDYLPEIDDIWASIERERLRQAFLNAGLQLAMLYQDEFLHEQALEVCQRLISTDACLEKAYCIAMQALAATNDRPGIVRLYDKLETHLETEIGIAPSTQTNNLFRSLITQL